MARAIGWIKKDPELGKLKIEARFFGNSLTFYRQAMRYEQWEAFEPNDEDWDKLTELAENKFRRGKVQEKHMKLVKARGEKF